MLCLYAITDAPPTDAQPQSGMDGSALAFVEAAGLACAVSVATGGIAPTPARVLDHQRVIEALMEQGAVLPFRFGSAVEDAAACRRLLAARAGELRAALDRLRDCVEYAVRLSGLDAAAGPAPATRAEGPGAAHMRALARRAGHWPVSTERFLDASLGAHVSGRTLWPRTPERAELRASFLVRRPQSDLFLADIGALQRARPDLALTCTGPWPPYSFTGDVARGETP